MKQYIKHIIRWGGTFIVAAGVGGWLVDDFNTLNDNKYPKLAWIIYVILILLIASYIYLKKIKEVNSEQDTTPQVVLLSVPGQLSEQ